MINNDVKVILLRKIRTADMLLNNNYSKIMNSIFSLSQLIKCLLVGTTYPCLLLFCHPFSFAIGNLGRNSDCSISFLEGNHYVHIIIFLWRYLSRSKREILSVDSVCTRYNIQLLCINNIVTHY